MSVIDRILMTPDDEMFELGYRKIEESNYGAYYEKTEVSGGSEYTHVIAIEYRKGGPIVLTYDKSYIVRYTNNTCDRFSPTVGLSFKEMKAVLRKFRAMAKAYKWDIDGKYIKIK